MDHRIRELQRRVAQGDTEAGEHLAYHECRMGQHIIRDDQIILSEDWKLADEDAGCCQCGNELYNFRNLCEMGRHRWFWHPEFINDLTYRCVRSARTLREQRDLSNALGGLWRTDIERAQTLFHEIQQFEQGHPYKYYGCQATLQADEACQQGMHFLRIIPGGKECRNPNCTYTETGACDHSQQSYRIAPNTDSEEFQCKRCNQAFMDAQICPIWGHKPDTLVDNPCVRNDCPEHKPGMPLYEALVATYRHNGKLVALCVENGRVVARAEGWNSKLKAMGIKKPKATNRVSGWGMRRHSVRVRYEGGNSRLTKGADYSDISENLKTRWAGNWYPVLRNLG